MYKKVMGALGIILLLVAGISFYDYQQSGQAVDLSTLSSDNKETASERQVAVYVTGEVAKPGVVYVPWEGRVGDAINQCGGLLPTADSSQVNMAATVKDGMEIRVKGKAISKDGNTGSQGNHSGVESSVASRASKTSSPEQGKNASGEIVNINTANVEELKKLKGIGPAMAQRIVDYREANGSFQAPEDIMQYIDLASDEKGGLSIRASLDNSRIWIVPEETKITVYVPSLEALSVSGSGDVRCRRFENPGELALTISGSTDLKFDFLSATGLSVSAAGSCDLEFGILQAKTADMALSGSGDIEVSDLQVNAVSASVAGSGDLELRGHAESAKFSVAGSGDINAAKLKCPATSVSVKGSGEIKYQDKDGNVLRTEK